MAKKSDDEYNKSIGCFNITESDDKSITFENKNFFNNNLTYNFDNKMQEAFGNTWKDDYDISVTINSWASDHGAISWHPKANQTFLLRSRQPIAGRYFKIVIGRPLYDPNNGEGGLKGYPDELGVSRRIGGPFSEDKKFQKRMWEYNDGDPVRTKQGGWIDILITSASRGISRKDRSGQQLGYIRMVAPEVSEMYYDKKVKKEELGKSCEKSTPRKITGKSETSTLLPEKTSMPLTAQCGPDGLKLSL